MQREGGPTNATPELSYDWSPQTSDIAHKSIGRGIMLVRMYQVLTVDLWYSTHPLTFHVVSNVLVL